MTMSEHALEVYHYSPSDSVFTKKTTKRRLGFNEVLIRTTHSGICYTDVHAKEKGCGLGHEGVGIVEKVGDAVESLKIGERVGWG